MQPVKDQMSEIQSAVFTGKISEIILPSSRIVKVRETNGDDDEILSNLGEAANGQSVMNFLANIVLEDSIKGGKPLVGDILNWPVSDRYYLLFKQRLINRGDLLEFSFVCQTRDCPSQKDGEKVQPLEEDLKQFDGDLSDPNYKPFGLHQPIKYPFGNSPIVELKLSSEKLLRYKILTGVLEQKQLALPADKTTKNTKLTIRELELYQNGNWVIQLNFKAFSSREMTEIRKNIDISDPLYDPIVKYHCPVCKTPYQIPLLAIPSFYWPEDQM